MMEKKSGIDVSEIYCLEYSKKEKAEGRFPYHYRKLFDGRHVNHFQDTDARGWHIVFVGEIKECEDLMQDMLEFS